MRALRPVAILILSAGLVLPPPVLAQNALPIGFVHLRAVDPSIAQDIRYAGPDNFTGRPIAGYEAGECILRREVADALQRVQADIVPAGFSLKVYDCYRPARAVRAMTQWANDGRPDDRRFHPRVDKPNLLDGYISQRSLHSTGIAVDLTLVKKDPAPSPNGNRAAPCNAPDRAGDGSIDMGTSYDCLDTDSHTRSPSATREQQRARMMLVSAMEKHGFRNYFREWWHFSYPGVGSETHYDFPVQ
jgi:D-alanyl-D-alanine dipeptidase